MFQAEEDGLKKKKKSLFTEEILCESQSEAIRDISLFLKTICELMFVSRRIILLKIYMLKDEFNLAMNSISVKQT